MLGPIHVLLYMHLSLHVACVVVFVSTSSFISSRCIWLLGFQLAFLLHSSSCHRLLLVEEHELMRSKPHSSKWQLILQNPFPGSVNFQESESDRFQILFNVSGTGEHIGYNITRDLNAIRVHLVSVLC